MLSYFAMIWEEKDPSAADLVTQIRLRMERDGLAPYSHFARPGLELFDFSRLPFGGNILALPNSPDGMGGAIFGSLFDRSAHAVMNS